MPWTCPKCKCEAGFLGCSNPECKGSMMSKSDEIITLAKELYMSKPMKVWDIERQEFDTCPFEELEDDVQEGIFGIAEYVIDNFICKGKEL